MDIVHAIEEYEPWNEQERVDRAVILDAIASDPLAFERSAPAHVTCSIWTVDAEASQTLMVYHNIYDSWSWIGGHADGERDLAAVALRELEEETGVSDARIVSRGGSGIFSLEVLAVEGHEKRGAYVSSHTHLNVTYLAVADPSAPLRIKADENSGIRWVSLAECLELSNEPWMRDRIYRKLVDKLRYPIEFDS